MGQKITSKASKTHRDSGRKLMAVPRELHLAFGMTRGWKARQVGDHEHWNNKLKEYTAKNVNVNGVASQCCHIVHTRFFPVLQARNIAS